MAIEDGFPSIATDLGWDKLTPEERAREARLEEQREAPQEKRKKIRLEGLLDPKMTDAAGRVIVGEYLGGKKTEDTSGSKPTNPLKNLLKIL